jgi:hypothetical protein
MSDHHNTGQNPNIRLAKEGIREKRGKFKFNSKKLK